MIAEPNRLPRGGRLDRNAPFEFTVDGNFVRGYPGDTVSSAMIAAGRLTVAPSIYRSRPRGIVAAGKEEPNAFIRVEGPCPPIALAPATTVAAQPGLRVRTLSGVGALDPNAERRVTDATHDHPDVLVVGAGPAGLAAALAASAGQARVLVVDDQPELGGGLLAEADEESTRWVAEARARLAERPEVTVVPRASVVGYYDQNYVLIAEHDAALRAQRLWHVRARRVVLATGALERPMVFAGNDLPGVMLAGAVRAYVNRYAAVPGRRVVVATSNDSTYATALDLAAAGVEVPAIVDSRVSPPEDLAVRARRAGIEVLSDSVLTEAAGEQRVEAVRVGSFEAPERETRAFVVDLLAVSGGWNPDVSLFSQSGGALRWSERHAAFLPDGARQAVHVVGAARGLTGFADCVRDGHAAGLAAAELAGYPAGSTAASNPSAPARAARTSTPDRPVWIVPDSRRKPTTWREHFVDLHRDATVADIARAVGAGMRSPEHVKRYTTIGTGADQGRTSNIAAVGVLAWLRGMSSPAALGTTTFRPPTTPVPFDLLAGRETGPLLDPVRTTSMHRLHAAAGAEFENVGQWKRPRFYPRDGEDMHAAVARECAAARTGVAMMDASTLGKIEVIGHDAGEFLNRIYTNGFKKLPVGSARYGILCHADGTVFDDGVVIRSGENHYYVTTTTGGAAGVLGWFEEWLQTEWRDLDVWCTSVTEQWATVALVGPRSREVLARLAPELDCSNESFGFMRVCQATVARLAAWIARVSFSGELAFEINVAWWYGPALWSAIAEAGAEFGVTPYGTDTMHVLRAEKGFPVVGQDTDGTVTPMDLGMDWIVSSKKDFVGRRSLSRSDMSRADRKQLVGLLPDDPDTLLPEGTQLVDEHTPVTPELGPVPMLGHVTSSYHSATLGRTFALALLRSGRHRIGRSVRAPIGDRLVTATITEPVFYDKEGARRDG